MAEYSRLASGQVSSTGGNTAVIIPFAPDFIEISNATRAAAGVGVTRAWWMKDMGQGAAFLVTTGASDVTSFISSATGGGFSTFMAGIALQYGPLVQHLGSPVSDFAISTAPAAQITTVGNHGLVTGNVVIFQNLLQTATTGMQQIAGIPFVVTVTGATTFTIPWNTNQSNYTAFNTATSTGNVGSYKQVLYPNLYAPNVGFVSAVTYGVGPAGVGLGNFTLITTSAPTNVSVGQQVAFNIPASYGAQELTTLPNVLIPGSPNYYFVTFVVSSTQFVINTAGTGYSAFNSNQLMAQAIAGGLSFPMVVAVGDQNSGSLLPNFQSPAFYNGFGAGQVSSINGPAIAGAFCNNTSQGFIIGASVAGTAADTIYWRAYLHDINYP